jgi:hypothetical protein
LTPFDDFLVDDFLVDDFLVDGFLVDDFLVDGFRAAIAAYETVGAGA